MAGQASAALAQEASNTASVTSPDGSDLYPLNNSATDSDTVVRLSVNKVAQSVTGPDADGVFVASYRVTVANPTSADAIYGQLIDTLDFPAQVEVLDANWTCITSGGPTCQNGTGSGRGPYVLSAANTPIMAVTTHTYTLSVRFRYIDVPVQLSCASGGGLSNSVNLPAGQELDALPNSACPEMPAPPTPGLALVKSGAMPAQSVVGASVNYLFTVTNTGQVTVRNLHIDDAKLDAPATCVSLVLEPGASTTCTGIYTLKQADIDAGQTLNTATASGTPPIGSDITSPPSSAVVPLQQQPAMSVIKTAGTPSENTVGSTLQYSFAVTNDGNVTLNGIVIEDALLDGPATCVDMTLLPGASTTCTGIRTPDAG